jgi:ABC-type amino acid transport substrate-binding protein
MSNGFGRARWGIKQFCFTLLLTLAAASVSSCGPGGLSTGSAPDALNRIQGNHLMRVGYIDWAPCISRQGRDGPLKGIYVDMVNEVASRLGVRVVWVETNLQNFATELNTGKIDFSVGPHVVTIPRAAAVSFTIPIDYVGNSGVVSASSPPKLQDIEDMNQPKIRVAVLQGQAIDEFAKAKLPNAQLVRLAGGDLTAPLVAVSAGRADIGFANTVTVEAYVHSHPEVRLFLPGGKELEILPHAWATPIQDTRLRDFLNAAIEYLAASGRIAEYQSKEPLKLRYPATVGE